MIDKGKQLVILDCVSLHVEDVSIPLLVDQLPGHHFGPLAAIVKGNIARGASRPDSSRSRATEGVQVVRSDVYIGVELVA